MKPGDNRTKKEKKEEALKIKKEIGARKLPKAWEPPGKEKPATANGVRYRSRKTRAKER